MAIPTPEMARVELRLGQNGRVRVYCDGAHLGGVMSVRLEGDVGCPASATIVLSGRAIRLVTEPPVYDEAIETPADPAPTP